MCEAFEKFKALGERDGEARGKREAMLALKDIVDFSGLTLPEVKKLQASMI